MMLYLFDIDGTLLQSDGVGRVAVEAALHRLFGRPVDTSSVSFSGKTDPQIFYEIVDHEAQSGRGVEDREEAVREAMRLYSEEMTVRLPDAAVEALPGAADFVTRLRDRSVPLGLLTGNLEPMAYAKLAKIGLDTPFGFGAFGSDHADRNSLPAIALSRALSHTGRDFAPCNTVIIGDTPRDIECARAIGAQAVAVATGRFSRDALAAYNPDVLLDTLQDAHAVLGH